MKLSFKTQARITLTILTFSFVMLPHYKKQFKSKYLKVCILQTISFKSYVIDRQFMQNC